MYPAAIAAMFTTKRSAIVAVREQANALIEQAERRAKGFDRGAFRDDDIERRETIAQRTQWGSDVAFELSRRWSTK